MKYVRKANKFNISLAEIFFQAREKSEVVFLFYFLYPALRIFCPSICLLVCLSVLGGKKIEKYSYAVDCAAVQGP